jgi:hypothetical protein
LIGEGAFLLDKKANKIVILEDSLRSEKVVRWTVFDKKKLL